MSVGLPPQLEASVRDCLSEAGHPTEVVEATPVSGGCIHQSLRISTALGESFFLKWSSAPARDTFFAEANGLEALADLGGPRVPEVIGYSPPDDSPSWLLLEFVPHGPETDDYWEALGRGIAHIHRPRPEPYGWEHPNYIGSLPQANEVTEDWSEFWWTRRLLPQLTTAREGDRLPEGWDEWELLEARLPDLMAGAGLETSLLHGDLWSGNVFAGPSGEPILVDPAVYRGHAEVDLAMTELFGGFPNSFYAAYWSVRPPMDGYREIRRSLYQLYPLLVHVNLFGGSYVGATYRTLSQI